MNFSEALTLLLSGARITRMREHRAHPLVLTYIPAAGGHDAYIATDEGRPWDVTQLDILSAKWQVIGVITAAKPPTQGILPFGIAPGKMMGEQ